MLSQEKVIDLYTCLPCVLTTFFQSNKGLINWKLSNTHCMLVFRFIIIRWITENEYQCANFILSRKGGVGRQIYEFLTWMVSPQLHQNGDEVKLKISKIMKLFNQNFQIIEFIILCNLNYVHYYITFRQQNSTLLISTHHSAASNSC